MAKSTGKKKESLKHKLWTELLLPLVAVLIALLTGCSDPPIQVDPSELLLEHLETQETEYNAETTGAIADAGTEATSEEETAETSGEDLTEPESEAETESTTEATQPATTQPANTQPATTAAPTQATTVASTQATTAATQPATQSGSSQTTALAGKTLEEYRAAFASLNLESATAIYQSDIDTVDQIILANGMNSGSRAEQILKVHDWLVLHIAYDTRVYSSEHYQEANYSIHLALTEGTCVCQGYAEAFYVFMGELGIPCMNIIGYGYSGGNAESHMWNAVQMDDGGWYYVDVTWDDPLVGNSSDYPDGTNLSYEYFLITYSEISGDHAATSQVPGNNGSSTAYHQTAVTARTNSQLQAVYDEYTSAGYVVYWVTSAEEIDAAVTDAGNRGYGYYCFLYDSNVISVANFTAQLQNALMNYAYNPNTMTNGFSISNSGHRNYTGYSNCYAYYYYATFTAYYAD